MKKRRILGMFAGICLLVCGCGMEDENTGAVLQKQQGEDTVAPSAQKDDITESENEEGGEQTGEESESKSDSEQSEEESESKSGGESIDGASENGKDGEREALILQREGKKRKERVEKQSQVLERYGTFLSEYASQGKERDSEEASGFALIYLDGDEIPELVLIDGYKHACGGVVYTFEEGNVVPVGEYGQYGTMHYQEKEGIVFDDYDTFGNLYSEVYRIEGSKETLLQSYSEYCMLPAEEENLQYTYTVDGKEVSEKEYLAVFEKWNEAAYSEIDYDMCRTLTDGSIRENLTEELENLILRQEEAVKREALLAAGAQEGDILLWDYDDYDGDGAYEAFMFVGDIFEGQYETEYKNEALWFAGADGNTLQLRDPYNYGYRMIDGKMDFGQRKYLYFYSDHVVTANISEIWTVRDGKPVEESGLYQRGEVIYRGENEKDEFEIWVDAYDLEHEIDAELDVDIWIGHTWKPYFYHYNSDCDRIEAYGGKLLSEEDFKELSKTNIIEEIRAEGYTVGDIIRWDNDIVTINYERHHKVEWAEAVHYENVIWDNNVKDFWQKETMHATSWRSAGVGGSYGL